MVVVICVGTTLVTSRQVSVVELASSSLALFRLRTRRCWLPWNSGHSRLMWWVSRVRAGVSPFGTSV